MKKIFTVLLFLLISLSGFSSHISGGHITYKCLGGNLYEVKLTYFWDCDQGFNPGTSQTIDVDGCGNNLSLTVNQSTATPGDGIFAAGLCPSASTTAACKRMIDYVGVVTLPSACNSWTFSISSCCRSTSANSPTSSGDSYIHYATLNNTTVTCNNSPDISVDQLPNFCLGQPACFNLGVTEVDGHVLSYSLISALESFGTPIVYGGSYSGAAPINGITINATTGQINFTPNTVGNFIVVVQVTERDANGVIIGTIMRDFNVIVSNCTNQTIPCGQGGISNVSSGTVPPGAGNTLQICENIPFCFDVVFSDPQVGDSVKISSPNLATSLPGATIVMSYTSGIKNVCKASICWTPPAGSSGLNTNFVLVVKDNACPVPGQQVIPYFIDVLPATSAGIDWTICGPQTASVNAVGSSTVFAWTDLAGTPIPVGPAFSCNPCNNPIITPAVTSTYVVTNVGGGSNCKNKDTVVVNVVPDFTLTANAALANGCLNTAVQFTSNVVPAGAYSYIWAPSSPLTSTNTANTSGVFSTPGSYVYTLTATSNFGCTLKSVTTPFTANPVVAPQFTVVPTSTISCVNGQVNLDVNLGAGNPTGCSTTPAMCVGPTIKQLFAAGPFQSNSSSNYPSPYSGWWYSGKHQFLIKSSDLLAAGVIPGKLSSLAFNITSLNGSPLTYPGFQIKIGCSQLTNLPTGSNQPFNTGLSTVYFNANQNIAAGWNTYNFTQAYEWDGTSNLIVEVCTGGLTTFPANASIELKQMSYIANMKSISTSSGVGSCPDINTNTSGSYMTNGANMLPNMRFGNCSSVPPATSFSYLWSPATGLSNAAVKNPTLTVTANQVYTVVVTPTAAVTCSTSGTSSISVTLPIMPTITAVAPICSNASTMQLAATPTGGTWSVTPYVTATGIFTPSLATIGTNTLAYTYGGVGCANTRTSSISVDQYIPSTITTTVANMCVNSPIVNLAPLTVSPLGVWSGNGVTGTNFNPAIAGAGNHVLTYSATSTPLGTCGNSSTLSINVGAVTVPTITPVTTKCSNAPAFSLIVNPPTGGTWTSTAATSSLGVFTPSAATIGNNTITHSFGTAPCVQTSSINISVEQYVPATITGTISNLCTSSTPVNLVPLTVSPLGTWSGSSGVVGTTFNPTIPGAGTYSLVYSTNSVPTTSLCPDSKTLVVTVLPIPQPSITAAGPYCNSFAPVTMTATGTGTITGGTWSSASGLFNISPAGLFNPGSSAIGTNTIIYTISDGPCTATTSANINIVRFIAATITGTINQQCEYNSPVALAPLALNQGGVWSGTGVVGPNFVPSNSIIGVQTLTYSTDPAPSGLCPHSQTTSVLVNAKPVVSITTNTNSPGCQPLELNLLATQSSTNAIDIKWSFGDGTDSAFVFNPTHTFVNAGTYTPVVSYVDLQTGCADTTISTGTEIITVYERPVANFDFSPSETTVIDAQVQYYNHTSPNLNAYTYKWYFDMLDSTQQFEPNYTFTVSGERETKLVAISDKGCTDTIIKKIMVAPDVAIYAANAFTPGNKDGLNDVFLIQLPPYDVDYTSVELLIYSRWGDVVFKTKDIFEPWLGSRNNNGDLLPTNVYVWKLRFMDKRKNEFEKLGHVTLLSK